MLQIGKTGDIKKRAEKVLTCYFIWGERKNRHEKQGEFICFDSLCGQKGYPEFLQELHFHRSRTGQMERIFFEAALANGINAFDTARVYMEAEHSFGNWLEKSGRREEVVILSKCGHPDAMWNKRVNEKEMRKDLKKSLEELKTDYIDIYMLHRDDPDTEVAVAVETF